MAWNTEDHRRKFLVSPGVYVGNSDSREEAELCFWGEWEPPSRVETSWPEQERLPQVLHRPYWFRPEGTSSRQNTDPWVFGQTMRYSNCRQIGARPHRRPNAMQALEPGSVICFGSAISGDYCVDTVFVVASSERWTPAEGVDEDEAFGACVVAPLLTNPDDAHLPLTLYRGATHDQPVNGMFSFAPARLASAADPRFARPAVRLDPLINPRVWRSVSGSKRILPAEEVRATWTSLRDQVLEAGLLLGITFETPPEGHGKLPASTRER